MSNKDTSLVGDSPSHNYVAKVRKDFGYLNFVRLAS